MKGVGGAVRFGQHTGGVGFGALVVNLPMMTKRPDWRGWLRR